VLFSMYYLALLAKRHMLVPLADLSSLSNTFSGQSKA
jgi:hypothetical protein